MLFHFQQRITRFLDHRSTSHEQRLCLIVYLVGTLMCAIGMPLHFSGIIGIHSPWLLVLSGIAWVICLVLLALYLVHRLSLKWAISLLGLLLQLLQSTRMVYQVVSQPEGYIWTLILNQVVSFTIMVYLVIAFVRYIPSIVAFLSLATLYFAYCYEPGAVSPQMLIIFTSMEVSTCMMGGFFRRNIHSMQIENTDYMNTEQGLLDAFCMTKSELVAYVQLCRNNNPDHHSVNVFFDSLDNRAENNLIRAVEKRMVQRRLRRANLEEIFPQLTPTELEVCHLIVAGNTLSQIAQLMNKTTNNISAVRIHVRKKLGLQTSEDLRQVLLKAIQQG